MGFSSDGDSRLLTAMKSEMKFGMANVFENKSNSLCVQDTIHILAKLRNRFLKTTTVLPMGNKQVTLTHLKVLIKVASKDVHGLVLKDICPDDRQNYRAVEKIMEPRVLEALTKYVPDCEATIMYLKLMKEIASSYTDYHIPPLERLQRIWHAVYFLRIWRKSITENNSKNNQLNSYKISQNFITSNAYVCVEINAQSMVNLIQKFRDEGKEEEFLITVFNSQICEKTFRQVRSMTTMNWTKINFSVLELTHLISRIELLNEVVYFKLKDVDIKFPRISGQNEKQTIFQLPSDLEIRNAMDSALECALKDSLAFGISMDEKEVRNCQLTDFDFSIEHNDDDEIDEFSYFNFHENEDISADLCDMLSENLCLKDYGSENITIDENSKFTQVYDKDGSLKTVRKSSLLWLLSNSKETVSSDRLQRVQNSSTQKKGCRRLEFSDLRPKLNRVIFISDQICTGQWCIFEIPAILKRDQKIQSNEIAGYVVGCVTAFVYANGKNEKEKQYTWDFASIENNNIKVSATWYFINGVGEFISPKGNNTFFTEIKTYIASIMEPRFEKESIETNRKIYLTPENFTDLQGNLNKIIKNKF